MSEQTPNAAPGKTAFDEPPAPQRQPIDAPLDIQQTHKIAEFEHDYPLTHCRFDPTGRYVFAGAEDFNIYRWDLASGAASKTPFTGHHSWVRSVDLSPDGQTLYTGGYDDCIGVWSADADLPQPEQMVEAHRGWVRWVRVSPDGKRLASCGNDNLVKIWNLPDMSPSHVLAGHQRYPYAVAFHPDGERLVSFDLMGVVKEWSLATGEELRTLEAKVMWGYDKVFAADMGGARDLRFSPNGSGLAVAGLTNLKNAFAGTHDPMILVFDWDKGEPRYQFIDADFGGMAWGALFHPDGLLIGGGSPRAGAKGVLWFLKEGEEKPVHTVPLSHGSRGIDLSPDGKLLAVAQVDNRLTVYQMTAPAVQ
ncbi:WD40 repeat domain-containing protein [Lignipirellula cremea]|uniref:WD domain, G-beta repeat n=1 Tax=Lignipirellula cremea TaxID=2528010 RepID=A0A518DQ55_9BACT|nr:WD40 repeat domain-containing protein [Lignipirellula cremea]QDU93958.1 WD domain, G-beta repeat [Lignipirellula cremea]